MLTYKSILLGSIFSHNDSELDLSLLKALDEQKPISDFLMEAGNLAVI